jgi:hypothetical protein
MLRRALFTVVWLAWGCSSSDFSVNPNNTEDSSTSSETGDTDITTNDSTAMDSVPVDTKPDPCAPDPAKAKFCITVSKGADHPAYTTEEATRLKLDGKGRVYVFVYDKDPYEFKDAVPVATIPYPPDTDVGAEVNIDADFPLTIIGSVATPGTYTVVALFTDSTIMRTKGAGGVLAGDFVSIPTVTGMKLTYPTMALSIGKTATVPMALRPVRSVTMTLTPSAGLKDKGPTVHGDGPVLFALTDDLALSGTTKWLHFETGGCADVDIDAFAPRSQDVTFNTLVEGAHNVFAAIFDYSATDPGFPGRGTLISPQATGTLPKVDIKKENWTAKVSVPLIDLAYGVETVAADKLTCPAPPL